MVVGIRLPQRGGQNRPNGTADGVFTRFSVSHQCLVLGRHDTYDHGATAALPRR
jgi:hypothetical protein